VNVLELAVEEKLSFFQYSKVNVLELAVEEKLSFF
jgi:hypothetical protein